MRGDSVLCIHYGQSNSGLAPSGKVYPVHSEWDKHILMFDDVFRELGGTRGWLGNSAVIKTSGLIEARDTAPDVQSILLPAAHSMLRSTDGAKPKIIIRGAGRGGQAFFGPRALHRIEKTGAKTEPYENLIATIKQAVDLAKSDHYPVSKIFIAFSHGENDRNMSFESYVERILEFFKDVEHDLCALEVPVHWFVDQPGGTAFPGNGNYWPNRLVTPVLPSLIDNCTFVGPRYQYSLYQHADGFQDPIHTSSKGKVLFGEVLGRAMAAVDQGETWDCVDLKTWEQIGCDIKIAFSKPIFRHAGILPMQPHECETKHGFYAKHLSVENVEYSDATTLIVTTNKPAKELAYAYRPNANQMRNGTVDTKDRFPLGRGELVEDWKAQSMFFKSLDILKFVPAFCLDFSGH